MTLKWIKIIHVRNLKSRNFRANNLLMFTDNKVFHPTPKLLFQKLIGGDLRYLNGRILEPSAGKGDMIDYIKNNFGWNMTDDLRIDAIENDSRLVNELVSKGINVVGDDFLTYETFKEYDYIVMNQLSVSGADDV